MSDKVSAKILADAKKRVHEIEALFEERKAKLDAEFETKKKAYLEETSRLVRLEEERIRREILSEARLGVRRELLEAKHETIRDTLRESVLILRESKSYRNILARIVSANGKGAELLLSPQDRKKLPFPWAKKASEAPILGGVVIRTSSRDINFSIDAAFEALGENLTLELARILFSENAPPSKQDKRKSKF